MKKLLFVFLVYIFLLPPSFYADDAGELLPVITKINVTQTTIQTSDGVTTIKKTLNNGSELDGTDDYLEAHTLTFDIELTGEDKPENVFILWNDTGADTTAVTVIHGGSGSVFILTNLDEGLRLKATKVAGAIYSTLLNLAEGKANNFAFWVYANNTGDNYTTLSGPHRFTVDGSAPSLTMTPPTDLVINPRGSITYSCNMSDSLSGNNKIMWQLKKPDETSFTIKQNYEDVASDGSDSITFTGDDTNLAGEYDVKCLAVDNVGNENTYTSTSSEVFTVHYTTTNESECGGNGSNGGTGSGCGAAVEIISPVPSSGGGGGGGGGGGRKLTTETESVESVTLTTGGKAGETKTITFTKDIGITDVDLVFQNSVNKAGLTVEKLATKPAETTMLEGKIHSFLKIDKQDLKDEDLLGAKIKFKVERAWLAKNGVLADEVVLKRYEYAEGWEKLYTKKVKTDKDHVYYEANTKGFSYFAIVAEKKPAPPITTAIPEEQKTAEPVLTEQQTEQAKERGSWLLAYLGILILVILICFIFIKKKFQKEERILERKGLKP